MMYLVQANLLKRRARHRFGIKPRLPLKRRDLIYEHVSLFPSKRLIKGINQKKH